MLRSICGVALLVLGTSGCGDTADSTGTGGTILEPGPTCTAFCAKVIESCGAFIFSETTCQQGCEGDLAGAGEVSEECESALDLGFQCVTELDCEGVYDWRDRVPVDDYPCYSASVLVEDACS